MNFGWNYLSNEKHKRYRNEKEKDEWSQTWAEKWVTGALEQQKYTEEQQKIKWKKI